MLLTGELASPEISVNKYDETVSLQSLCRSLSFSVSMCEASYHGDHRHQCRNSHRRRHDAEAVQARQDFTGSFGVAMEAGHAGARLLPQK